MKLYLNLLMSTVTGLLVASFVGLAVVLADGFWAEFTAANEAAAYGRELDRQGKEAHQRAWDEVRRIDTEKERAKQANTKRSN